MNRISLLCLAVLSVMCCLGLGSCGPQIYFPHKATSPGLHAAGDLKVNASGKLYNGVGDRALTALSADAAWSPVDHLGVYAGVHGLAVHSSLSNNKFNGSRLEYAVGYYDRIGSMGVVGIYGGAGNGYINHTVEGVRHYEANYFRFFLQPEIGFNAENIYEMYGGLRVVVQRYGNFRSDDPAYRYSFLEGSQDINGAYLNLLEPYLNMSIGGEKVKFTLQTGLTIAYGDHALKEFDPIYSNVGVTLFINRFNKRPVRGN